MPLPDFVIKAIYVFKRLDELGAKGTYMVEQFSLTIIGTEQPLGVPVNDNEAKP